MAGTLYRQIADELRRDIAAGKLKPGDQLPTEEELAERFAASRNTVRVALRELISLGLVDTQHGKGTFVFKPVPSIVTTLTTDPVTGSGGGEGLVYTAEVERNNREATTGLTVVELQKANETTASSLRLSENDGVVSRHEPRYVDGEPWSLQTSFYPMWLVKEAPDLLSPVSIPDGTVKYLRGCGFTQAGYRDAVEVRAPNAEEIKFFGLPVDGRIQVIEIFRVAFDQKAKRIRLTITVYRADRNRFVFNVGDVPVSENALTRPR